MLSRRGRKEMTEHTLEVRQPPHDNGLSEDVTGRGVFPVVSVCFIYSIHREIQRFQGSVLKAAKAGQNKNPAY